MEINAKGLKLIKEFEGCKLSAYRDIVGVWTIGYGHTGDDVRPGMSISQEQADALLAKDVSNTSHHVSLLLKADLNDNQFSALVCFAYNLGCAALARSTLLKKVNGLDAEGAAEEFLKWSNAGGKPVAGLLRRRQAERALFLSAD